MDYEAGDFIAIYSRGKWTVAVVGHAEDWAAYESHEGLEETRDYGDKLSENMAREIFPQLKHMHYRD